MAWSSVRCQRYSALAASVGALSILCRLCRAAGISTLHATRVRPAMAIAPPTPSVPSRHYRVLLLPRAWAAPDRHDVFAADPIAYGQPGPAAPDSRTRRSAWLSLSPHPCHHHHTPYHLRPRHENRFRHHAHGPEHAPSATTCRPRGRPGLSALHCWLRVTPSRLRHRASRRRASLRQFLPSSSVAVRVSSNRPGLFSGSCTTRRGISSLIPRDRRQPSFR